MSLLNTIKVKLGISPTQSNNFVLDASAADGTMKLARASGQDILTANAAGILNAVQGLQKGGSVVQALSDFTGANASLASSGYQKLPSGLIIQWGATAISALTTGSATLPITFPNTILSAVASARQVNGDGELGVSAYSVSSISFRNRFNGSISAEYIAIGY